MKVRADALFAMLEFAISPSPLYIRHSICNQKTLRISDYEDRSTVSEFVLFKLDDSSVYMASPSWERLLEEYRTQGDIYYRFCQEMTEFVVRVPHRLWFPTKPAKQPVLPPYDNVLTGGPLDAETKDWSDKFST